MATITAALGFPTQEGRLRIHWEVTKIEWGRGKETEKSRTKKIRGLSLLDESTLTLALALHLYLRPSPYFVGRF